MSTPEAFAPLIGQTITAIHVDAADQSHLRFSTEADPLILVVDGDCCSESWFADLTGVGCLIGGAVRAVEELPMVDGVVDGRGRQDCDQVYGYRIDTDKGSATLAFRNSSNGYYGGGLSRTDSAPKVEWAAIIGEDWQA